MKATPLALLLASVLASPLCAAGLDARLTLVEGSTDDVRVNLTLTNTGDKPIRLLKWQLPGSEDAPLFLVERDGEKVGYEGALIKRAAPTDKDFQLLKAGQSLTLPVAHRFRVPVTRPDAKDRVVKLDQLKPQIVEAGVAIHAEGALGHHQRRGKYREAQEQSWDEVSASETNHGASLRSHSDTSTDSRSKATSTHQVMT